MKTTIYSAFILMAGLSGHAAANSPATQEHAATAPKVVLYSDGRNTYIKAVPGLIVQGATADGDRLILPGVQHEVQGYLGGRPITIAHQSDARITPPAPSPSALNERLKRIEEDLQRKEKALALATKAVVAGPVPEPVTPAVPEQVWELRKSDGTIFNALSRWAASATPKRQIVFATENNDFPADTEASISGDFDHAVEAVARSLQNSRYPIRVCFWDNKPHPVVKIIHKTKRCED